MTRSFALALVLIALTVGGCSTVPPTRPPAGGHLRDEAQAAPRGSIPAPVQAAPALPKPRRAAKAETYSVVVNNVRVQELLFALARDAKLNVDIHPGITGTVTLNAIDQTLPQLLSRIAKQADMRYELDGPNLVVMPDSPFLRTYKVDYVNMSRELSGTVSINTQIASSAASGSTTGGGTGSAIGAGNVSTTSVKNESKNRFWEELEKNVKDILRETDKILPEGSSETVIERADTQSTTGTGATAPTSGRSGGAPSSLAGSPNPAALQNTGTTVVKRTTFREAASVIVSPETGVVTVRATARQHEKVQEFLDHVLASAKRQVLIEATIVEVSLNDGYQQGIDWSRLRTDGSGFSIAGPTLGGTTGTQIQPFVLSYLNRKSPLDLRITLDLLESFGTVRVLSSPRLSVINNQTALLKIVDSIVYFNVKADTTQAANTGTLTSFTTTPQSVSVGLVMAVTPQISENDAVILNVRPTISSVTAFKQDPNPSIPAGLQNLVPEIRTREIESILRVSSGDIAVLGGLMEERTDFKTGRLPILGLIPGLGEVVTNRNNAVQKTELVVFLRPIVVRDASIDGDYSSYREQLPGEDFFHDPQARERRLPKFESYNP